MIADELVRDPFFLMEDEDEDTGADFSDESDEEEEDEE